VSLGNQIERSLYCCVAIASLPPEQYVSTRTLAEFYDLPKEYLSKALQQLSRASIVTPAVGPSGGYRLAKDSAAISVLDIIEAINGGTLLAPSSQIYQNLPFPPDFLAGSPIDRAMRTADEQWRKSLKAVSLANLVDAFESETKGTAWKENVLRLAGKRLL